MVKSAKVGWMSGRGKISGHRYGVPSLPVMPLRFLNRIVQKYGRTPLILITVGVSCCAKQTLAQEFEVYGDMILQSIMPGGGPGGWKVKKNFKIAVSGCKALMFTSNENASVSSQMSFDSGTIYQMESFFDHRGVVTLVTNAGSIVNYAIPSADSSGINYLWLAYASGCYFASLTNDFVRINWGLSPYLMGMPDITPVKALWKLSKYPPALPIEIEFLNNGVLQGNDNSGNQTVIPASPPFDQGYTNNFFEQIGTTNVTGMEIPTGFRYICYCIYQNKLQPRLIVTSSNNLVKAGASVALFRPVYKERVSISDFRFKDASFPVKVIRYFNEKGRWRNQKAVEPLYNMAVKVANANAKDNSNPNPACGRSVPIWLFVIASIGFLIFIWRVRNKTVD